MWYMNAENMKPDGSPGKPRTEWLHAYAKIASAFGKNVHIYDLR